MSWHKHAYNFTIMPDFGGASEPAARTGSEVAVEMVSAEPVTAEPLQEQVAVKMVAVQSPYWRRVASLRP